MASKVNYMSCNFTFGQGVVPYPLDWISINGQCFRYVQWFISCFYFVAPLPKERLQRHGMKGMAMTCSPRVEVVARGLQSAEHHDIMEIQRFIPSIVNFHEWAKSLNMSCPTAHEEGWSARAAKRKKYCIMEIQRFVPSIVSFLQWNEVKFARMRFVQSCNSSHACLEHCETCRSESRYRILQVSENVWW